MKPDAKTSPVALRKAEWKRKIAVDMAAKGVTEYKVTFDARGLPKRIVFVEPD
jgi:hypothetical protein